MCLSEQKLQKSIARVAVQVNGGRHPSTPDEWSSFSPSRVAFDRPLRMSHPLSRHARGHSYGAHPGVPQLVRRSSSSCFGMLKVGVGTADCDRG